MSKEDTLQRLALEGGYPWGNQDPTRFATDVSAYRRVTRKDVPFGHHEVWDLPYDPTPEPPSGSAFGTLDTPYINRVSGIQRGLFYSPDGMGKLLRASGIHFIDCPGEGMLESLMIARKYGLRPTFSLPTFCLPLQYTPDELVEHRSTYAKALEHMVRWLNGLKSTVGYDMVADPDQIWLLYGLLFDDNPFMVFCEKYREKPAAVEEEFRSSCGFDLPVNGPLDDDPVSRAQRIHFWRYVRRKYGEVIRARAELARERFAGRIVGNAEFDNIVDYEQWGTIFDIPGVNVRTMLIDDEVGRRYWVGYAVRLANDLMNKPPMVSVRINLPGAGARVVPTPGAIKTLFSEAVQNGAAGFYHWLHDFAADRNGYSGPAFGNPDGSSLPKLRWRASLEVAGKLQTARVFLPPESEVGVLVSTDNCALGEWKRIFAAYAGLRSRGIWHRFVSDQEIRADRTVLDSYRLLFVPILTFADMPVVEALEAFVAAGGILVVCDPAALTYDLRGDSLRGVRERVLGVRHIGPVTPRNSIVTSWPASRQIDQVYEGAALEPTEQATPCARYDTGETAAVLQRRGKGASILVGAALMDTWVEGREAALLEKGRLCWYRDMVDTLGLPDRSWVWRVTVDNVANLTGSAPSFAREVDPDVVFMPYMYRHGDQAAHPAFLEKGLLETETGSPE